MKTNLIDAATKRRQAEKVGVLQTSGRNQPPPRCLSQIVRKSGIIRGDHLYISPGTLIIREERTQMELFGLGNWWGREN